MPSYDSSRADALFNRVNQQYRIWKLERDLGLEPSLSWWGFRPELEWNENMEEHNKLFRWNNKMRRFEDELFPGFVTSK